VGRSGHAFLQDQGSSPRFLLERHARPKQGAHIDARQYYDISRQAVSIAPMKLSLNRTRAMEPRFQPAITVRGKQSCRRIHTGFPGLPLSAALTLTIQSAGIHRADNLARPKVLMLRLRSLAVVRDNRAISRRLSGICYDKKSDGAAASKMLIFRPPRKHIKQVATRCHGGNGIVIRRPFTYRIKFIQVLA